MNKFKLTSVLIFVFVILHFTQSTASAHKVSIYAYAEAGEVFAEGYFVDGSKAKNSRIEVFDAGSGKKLLEVKTDKKGEASFKIPEVAPLKLVITASMGHKNDYTISENEVREAMGISKVEVRSQESEDRERITERGPQIPETTGAVPATHQGLSSSEIEAIVDRTLEKKLRPIKNILLQIQESSSRPGISEILGGIGYILGLMGIVMYFKSRRR
ncbi:MAG: hypothetical protein VST72_00935 [Nitrospirota bacterium]|nr:hypothetical protein [Nitrospirota bacterium]